MHRPLAAYAQRPRAGSLRVRRHEGCGDARGRGPRARADRRLLRARAGAAGREAHDLRRRAGGATARSAGPPADQRLPAGAARAPEGAAGAAPGAPRPARHRALARTRRDASPVLEGAGPAQRSPGEDPRGTERAGGACDLGPRACRRRAGPARGPGGGDGPRCRDLLDEGRRARPDRNPDPRVQAEIAGAGRSRSSSPSSRPASTRISNAASRATAPTATSSRSSATGASCGPTGLRASSGWPCSRCCSPSGPSSQRSAARRR